MGPAKVTNSNSESTPALNQSSGHKGHSAQFYSDVIFLLVDAAIELIAVRATVAYP